jgi:hypothetical protein
MTPLQPGGLQFTGKKPALAGIEPGLGAFAFPGRAPDPKLQLIPDPPGLQVTNYRPIVN